MDVNIAAFISPRKQGGSIIHFLCQYRTSVEQSADLSGIHATHIAVALWINL